MSWLADLGQQDDAASVFWIEARNADGGLFTPDRFRNESRDQANALYDPETNSIVFWTEFVPDRKETAKSRCHVITKFQAVITN